MEKETDLFGLCPYYTSQRVLAGKWALIILHHLEEGTLRFKELERRLAPITQATLTKQLRNLEAYGLVKRKVYQQIPPKVEYSLSDLGNEFRPVLSTLKEWGEKYNGYLETQK